MRFKTSCARICLLLVCAMALPNPGISVSSSVEETLNAYLKAFPDVKSIGVIYSESGLEEKIKELETGARAKDIKVVRFRAKTIKEFPGAVRDVKEQVDTFWILEDPLYSMQEAWSFFVFFTLRNRIKTVVSNEQALKDCGLFYYSDSGETIINKRMLDILGLKVSDSAGAVKYHVPGS